MRDFGEPICLPPEGRHPDRLADIYAALAARQEAKERAADEEAARLHGEIGHNGGPEIKEPKEPFGLKSRWLHFVKELDLRRLARIEYRLSLVELVERFNLLLESGVEIRNPKSFWERNAFCLGWGYGVVAGLVFGVAWGLT